jgi:hypothetical protein
MKRNRIAFALVLGAALTSLILGQHSSDHAVKIPARTPAVAPPLEVAPAPPNPVAPTAANLLSNPTAETRPQKKPPLSNTESVLASVDAPRFFYETPAPEPSPSRAPLESGFKLGVSAGPTWVTFQQTGALGAGSGSALAATSLEASADFEAGLWRLHGDFQNYSLNFGTSTTDLTQTVSKNLQQFTLEGGYGFFQLGVQLKTIPVLMATSASTLSWASLTTLSPTAGIHLENDWNQSSQHPITASVDLNASRPVSGSGVAGQLQASGFSGFGANLGASVKKTLVNETSCKLKLGIDGGAAYSRLSYTGTTGSAQGTVTQALQEYSAKLGLEFDF